MKDKKEAIYLVAVLPPEEIRKEINVFKNYAAGAFQSKHALKAPPHIPAFPSFKFEEEKENYLGDVLNDLAEKEIPFYVQFKDFDCFAPKVIYIKVEQNQGMHRLHRALVSTLYTEFEIEHKSPHRYQPNLNIAFKDLKGNYFMKAWSHFGRTKYERAFQADYLTLLKHEDGVWNIIEEYKLGPE